MTKRARNNSAYPGSSLLSEDAMEKLRVRAWQEQRILIVSPHDERLTFFDKTRLCEIGNRFYGNDRPNENE